MKKLLFVLALAVVATACHKEKGGDVTTESGKITITAQTRSEVESTEQANTTVLTNLPAVEDFAVSIVGNNETYSWSTLAEFNTANERNLTFVSGPYTITLSHGESGAIGWSKPLFRGATTVEVPMYGLTVDAAIEVVLANSIISISTTELFDGYFPSATFAIEGIEWDAAREEYLFMNAGEVNITCDATRQNGSTVSLKSNVTLSPTTHHIVEFDLSTAGNTTVNVVFDSEIVETIEIDTELNENA